MDDMEIFISDFTDFLNKYRMERAILYGPFLPEADGRRRDVIVILISKRFEGYRPHERKVGACAEVTKLLGRHAVIDLHLYTPKEFEHALKYLSLIQMVVRNGIIIRP